MPKKYPLTSLRPQRFLVLAAPLLLAALVLQFSTQANAEARQFESPSITSEPGGSAVAQRWNVVDQHGLPLADAVVMFDDGRASPDRAAATFVMAQEQRQFVPRVLVVPVGARVAIPNRDVTHHHVYSFSPAKTFELKLYRGDDHAPLLFDNPGLVELGCNIHDRMKGFILVTDDPVWGLTDRAGNVELPTKEIDLATVELNVWHPRALQKHPARQHQLANEPRKIILPVSAPLKPVKRGLGSWKSGRGK